MPSLTFVTEPKRVLPPENVSLDGKRHLTPSEIYVLIQNRNISSDPEWQNVWVCDEEGKFDPHLIVQSEFHGFVVLGALRPAILKFHDLELRSGIYRSFVENVVTGDDFVIHNVSYLSNYRIGNNVILFNIQEMSCTNHSKFGEGILKEGEPEKNRIWIGVGNENDARAVLPFTDMIPADAYIWSRYREDAELLNRFLELTEKGNARKLDTYGIVEDNAVIKNCTLLKDAKIGNSAYIKGAFKLKNISVLSSPDEVSQIGEGVELVNGILGYGCRVFYQAIAVRFVIGRNCQLKYGARLLNSVLGDNSTVSCCELLNNLIFPFHEQHHNSSFLIASTVMGQSNIASAATIGSNHNSRSPDGEMLAGRGFWPGLCSDFKFDSRFASFVLVNKGSYQNELNITYPFSLVTPADKNGAIHIIPAYWFLYNMFAIVRNKYKFSSRDKRKIRIQQIETNPLAPDTMQEVLSSVNRIIELTGRYLQMPADKAAEYYESNMNLEMLSEYQEKARSLKDNDLYVVARDYLHRAGDQKFILRDDSCQKKKGALIYKPAQGYKKYRQILKYFAVECFVEWTEKNNFGHFTQEIFERMMKLPLYTKWVNVGGQVIPEEKLMEMFAMIKDGRIQDWHQVHDFYTQCHKSYCDYKLRYAIYILEWLYSKAFDEFTLDDYANVRSDVAEIAMEMYESSINSRNKDYTDFFRSVTFRNKEEQEAVLGKISDSEFLKELKSDTDDFLAKLYTNFNKIV